MPHALSSSAVTAPFPLKSTASGELAHVCPPPNMLALKGLSSVFGRGRSTDSREAKELLATVDDLLSQSNKLLNSISRRIPSKQFETFEHKYTELNLMVIEVKDDIQGREQKRIFFESEEEKEAFQSDIRKLLQQCQTYRNDVVATSRRVQGDVVSDPDIQEATTGTPSPSSLQWVDNLTAPVLSMVADATSQGKSIPGKASMSGVDHNEDQPTKRFIATVSRKIYEGTIDGDSTSSSHDEDPYIRILFCVNRSKRAMVVGK
ncbi:hypothetical protein RHS01_09854 [Rhizoctonia solani]|uniref:Uncharacterized protein n=1 Tax=Rhizoctonia solani TaxID=456999 RepID=A0A8H7M0J1_9AGAM|nr:hypothetical protein RHS01_09854 [Rhizoctonia solani]